MRGDREVKRVVVRCPLRSDASCCIILRSRRVLAHSGSGNSYMTRPSVPRRARRIYRSLPSFIAENFSISFRHRRFLDRIDSNIRFSYSLGINQFRVVKLIFPIQKKFSRSINDNFREYFSFSSSLKKNVGTRN